MFEITADLFSVLYRYPSVREEIHQLININHQYPFYSMYIGGMIDNGKLTVICDGALEKTFDFGAPLFEDENYNLVDENPDLHQQLIKIGESILTKAFGDEKQPHGFMFSFETRNEIVFDMGKFTRKVKVEEFKEYVKKEGLGFVGDIALFQRFDKTNRAIDKLVGDHIDNKSLAFKSNSVCCFYNKQTDTYDGFINLMGNGCYQISNSDDNIAKEVEKFNKKLGQILKKEFNDTMEGYRFTYLISGITYYFNLELIYEPMSDKQMTEFIKVWLKESLPEFYSFNLTQDDVKNNVKNNFYQWYFEILDNCKGIQPFVDEEINNLHDYNNETLFKGVAKEDEKRVRKEYDEYLISRKIKFEKKMKEMDDIVEDAMNQRK